MLQNITGTVGPVPIHKKIDRYWFNLQCTGCGLAAKLQDS